MSQRELLLFSWIVRGLQLVPCMHAIAASKQHNTVQGIYIPAIHFNLTKLRTLVSRSFIFFYSF
jgi:hypothetical protein